MPKRKKQLVKEQLYPFILDSCNARIPEGRDGLREFKPVVKRPHVATEMVIAANWRHLPEHERARVKEWAESTSQKLMPHLRDRVLTYNQKDVATNG